MKAQCDDSERNGSYGSAIHNHGRSCEIIHSNQGLFQELRVARVLRSVYSFFVVVLLSLAWAWTCQNTRPHTPVADPSKPRL